MSALVIASSGLFGGSSAGHESRLGQGKTFQLPTRGYASFTSHQNMVEVATLCAQAAYA